MFTGVAILQLVQANKMRYTDTLSNLLPFLSTWSKKITVNQLLTHTSGLGSIWTDEFNENPRKYCSVKDYLPLIVKQQLQFSPGSDWAYSNAGYIILGAVIEQLTGKSYRSYICDSIFVKAGMSTETNDDDIEQYDIERAIPYTTGGLFGSKLVSAEETGLWTMMPAGGAVLSADDLWKFALALKSYKLLNKAYTDTCINGKVHYRETASYGHGFANEYQKNDTIIFHDGGAEGISEIRRFY
jgi:CubicO group peptidase (beta-lactamase class C family)